MLRRCPLSVLSEFFCVVELPSLSTSLSLEAHSLSVMGSSSLFAVAERPQHMLMRVSVGIHGGNIETAIETYNLLSERW